VPVMPVFLPPFFFYDVEIQRKVWYTLPSE
jgi:hypothetical protein